VVVCFKTAVKTPTAIQKDREKKTMAFTQVEIAQFHAAVTAAAQPDDLYKLGLVYATGQGGAIDLIEAHKWFNLAAVRGLDAAKASRKELADQMSADEVAAAQRAAREWLVRH
jgi:TPR repeat protein